jgi:hypothetical protein
LVRFPASSVVRAILVAGWIAAGFSNQAAAQSATAAQPPAPDTARGASPGVRIFPRPGGFFLPPAGPGFYSLVDQLRNERREAAPPSGYPAFAIMAPPFYEADFRYLDSMPSGERRPFERLKRVRFGDDFMVSTGGSAWYRFHDEHNSRLTTTDQTYSLGRVRTYGDLWYRDWVRVYAEFIAAGRSDAPLPPLAVDSNHADLLNAFADVKIFERGDHPAYVRVGRQEMLLGSQRFVSPLPWANMRRNFDGVRVFRQGARFDVDAFWLEPVVPNATEFDEPSHDVQFAGAWLTYRPRPGRFFDVYYLYSNNAATLVQQGITTAPSRFSTIGSRYAGDRNNVLWDVEAAVQFGRQGDDQDLAAGMVAVGVGRRFASVRSTPTIWVYYDYATGDGDPNAGRFTTANQLYPFGHYYLGWADIAGRQNIQDANVHVGLYPVPWITVWLQYHHLWLSRTEDALYNAGGTAIRRDPTGSAGVNVGDDVDIVLNFHVDALSDVMVAYTPGFGGRFLESTAGPNRASSTRAFYLIYNFRW